MFLYRWITNFVEFYEQADIIFKYWRHPQGRQTVKGKGEPSKAKTYRKLRSIYAESLTIIFCSYFVYFFSVSLFKLTGKKLLVEKSIFFYLLSLNFDCQVHYIFSTQLGINNSSAYGLIEKSRLWKVILLYISLYALIQVFTTPEATPGKCCKYWTKLHEDIFILTTKIPLLNILFMHLFRLFYLVLPKAKCNCFVA